MVGPPYQLVSWISSNNSSMFHLFVHLFSVRIHLASQISACEKLEINPPVQSTCQFRPRKKLQTLPQTNSEWKPQKNLWLEDEMSFWKGLFSQVIVSLREGRELNHHRLSSSWAHQVALDPSQALLPDHCLLLHQSLLHHSTPPVSLLGPLPPALT